MRHPIEVVVSRKHRPRVLAFLIIVAAIFLALRAYLGRGLSTDQVSHGVFSFELAGNPVVAQAQLDSWVGLGSSVSLGSPAGSGASVPPGLGAVQASVGVDFAFLLCGSTALALCCAWAARNAQRPWLVTTGILLAWGQWLAALLGGVENILLLRILGRVHAGVSLTLPPTGLVVPDAFVTQAIRTLALTKYALIEAGLAYVAACGLNYSFGHVLRRRRQTARSSS